MSDYKVCKLCVLKYGLTGQSLSDGSCKYAFKTEKELIKHLRTSHGLEVKDDKLYE